MTRRIVVVFFAFIALLPAFAQAQIEFAEPVPYTDNTPEPLRSACNGAWHNIDYATYRGVHPDIDPTTTEGRETVRCLLSAINNTTFDRSAQFNNVMAMNHIDVIMRVLGEPSFDVFAELVDSQPKQISSDILSLLADRGHPEAWRRHFAVMASKVSGQDEWKTRVNTQAPGLFKPFLERGTCAASECSRHIGETLQIFSRNLDIIDAELQGSEEFTDTSRARTAQRDTDRVRAAAREMRDLVHRIQRGEARMAQAAPAGSQ